MHGAKDTACKLDKALATLLQTVMDGGCSGFDLAAIRAECVELALPFDPLEPPLLTLRAHGVKFWSEWTLHDFATILSATTPQTFRSLQETSQTSTLVP